MITKTHSGRTATWFIFDDLYNSQLPKTYKAFLYDEDGDVVDNAGGIDFSETMFASELEAKRAVQQALEKANISCYPPVKVEIVRVTSTATVQHKNVQVNWS